MRTCPLEFLMRTGAVVRLWPRSRRMGVNIVVRTEDRIVPIAAVDIKAVGDARAPPDSVRS